jgi:short-subunit dehydrogenase
VAVTGRDRAALQEVAGDTGGVSIAGDLREPGRSRLIVDAAAQALDGLDAVVSNAGAGWSGQFAMMTGEEIDDLLDVNLRASAHVAHAALPYLRPGAGHLVFVGSIAGLVGVPGEAWYSATKAGLATLADVLRVELKAQGVAVTLVTSGVVDTPYFERRNSPYLREHPRPISARTSGTPRSWTRWTPFTSASTSAPPRSPRCRPKWSAALSWPPAACAKAANSSSS